MADTKLTALSATTTPLSTDLMYVVTDPGGTPTSNKATLATMKTINAASDQIYGLLPTYVDATHIGASVGNAYIEGLGVALNASPANIAPTLSANTVYYLYLYVATVGTTPVLVSSTTVPASTPFAGTARSASASIGGNAANLHRLIGWYTTDNSGDIFTFTETDNGKNFIRKRWNTNFRKLSAGSATSMTNVSLAPAGAGITGLPPVICPRAYMAVYEVATSGYDLILSVDGTNTSWADTSSAVPSAQKSSFADIDINTTTPSINYINVGAAGQATYIDIFGALTQR